MDESNESKIDGFRHLSKSRVMGKLFGREKKLNNNNNNNEDEVSAFLHGPSDKLYMVPSTAPPKFPKLDTSNAHRWPTAAEVIRSRDSSFRGRSASPKRSKKGLIVRFTDTQPEIIGEGGDEAEAPTLEISKRKRSNSHPVIIQRTTQSSEKIIEQLFVSGIPQVSWPVFVHPTQTVHENALEIQLAPSESGEPNQHSGSNKTSSSSIGLLDLGAINSNSDPVRALAEMRAAEGTAFKLASRSLETVNQDSSGSIKSDVKGLTPNPLPIHTGTLLPLQVPPQVTPGQRLIQCRDGDRPASNSRFQAAEGAVGVEAVENFSNRLQHLFKLFERSAESVLPITGSSFEAWVRAASWWFLKGRASLENVIRARPSSPESPRNYNILPQQGHADVAKSLWIIRDIITHRAELKMHQADDLTDLVTSSRKAGDDFLADMLERCQAIAINLRMLIKSMQRNDCLPPPAEEAPLPQGLDTSIWIQYPSFPPDVIAMLSTGKNGALSVGAAPNRVKISDAMPLGDTRKSFEYARMFVDVFLVEEGVDSPQNRCPSILFVSRAQTDKNLTITVSSQSELLLLGVKSDREYGMTWSDVKWQSRMSAIEVKLPRGFAVRIQCSPNDYKTLWNMYDYTSKIHANLRPRKDEKVVFESTLKTFQYFDRDPQSRVFPKEPIARCHIRVLERSLTEAAGTGTRRRHQGFRVVVITSTTTKNLSGISQEMLPGKPLQYGLSRGEEGAPTLQLKFDDGTKCLAMVLAFDNVTDRSQLYNCISGGVGSDERALAYLPVKDFSITRATRSDYPIHQDALDSLEWQGAQVIGKDMTNTTALEGTPTTLCEDLRIVVDSKTGNITDRMSVGRGELSIRLSTHLLINEIMILREPQMDLSISISDSQGSKEMLGELTTLLETIAKSQTIRKYTFLEIRDLHVFQAVVTGFRVLFDGVAEGFAISRRRTVVPIHKKWEASHARIQILQRDKVVQLAAFFDSFSHGECMNFVLKATDALESFNRNGKFVLRMVDAKFSMPKGGDESYKGDDKGFINLDMPDYPGEHDDITISFDSQANREKFLKSLPAPVKTVSKLGTVRK